MKLIMKVAALSIFLLIFTLLSTGQNISMSKVAQLLDTVLLNDQVYRSKIDSIAQKFGWESKEMQLNDHRMLKMDSINTVKVSAIIDNFGWLGPDEIGKKGSLALFLTIQHSDLKTQEKYLPLMKEAAKNGKLNKSELALLMDRVEMFSKRPQIFGSQIQMIDGKLVIYKIVDEINVNKRRAEYGLEPLEDYAKRFNIEYRLPSK